MVIFTGLSDEEIHDYQEKGELVVAGHVLSGTDLKVKFIGKAVFSRAVLKTERCSRLCSKCCNRAMCYKHHYTEMQWTLKVVDKPRNCKSFLCCDLYR